MPAPPICVSNAPEGDDDVFDRLTICGVGGAQAGAAGVPGPAVTLLSVPEAVAHELHLLFAIQVDEQLAETQAAAAAQLQQQQRQREQRDAAAAQALHRRASQQLSRVSTGGTPLVAAAEQVR